jgi:alkanesulfonate monooxygenase SsuD/methylene tetrahydromethanopterin reductase-like flavin-dependent oxidoreductase (luciferase family)
LFGGNAFKLGLFGVNCSSGLSLVNIPERWDGDWERGLAVAKQADEVGIECLVPLQRWKGYGGASDVNLHCLESIARLRPARTDAAHLRLRHGARNASAPGVRRQQMATADCIGRGRFGVNLVPGSNAGEFHMFGHELDEHANRYVMAQEWWDVIRRIWSGGDEFDFDGRFFKTSGRDRRPVPHHGTTPPMMNAGASW